MALAKGSRITGTQRTELAAVLAQRYAGGESIRALADDTGRSFGFVHGLIKESGVPVRSRGGATRGAAAKLPAGGSATAAAKPPKKAKDKKNAKNDDSKKSKKGKKR